MERDDQQSTEQQQGSGKACERGVFEEAGRYDAHVWRAHHDDAGSQHEPRPNDACKRAGPHFCFRRIRHGISPHSAFGVHVFLRTGATTAASATTRDRLEEMAEFYLAIRDAMESALQRWRAKGAPGSNRQARARE
jgi:hypothetical protein